MYQRMGGTAFNKDLCKTRELLAVLGNPHEKFASVHIAGTNGKGSSAHMITSILMESGYRTGLYTSPHLKEFTERIRIDGSEVSKEFVIDFVNRYKDEIDSIKPSFFETTVAMAFDYFAKEKVDIAVIEVGMGGRLDSTNVVTPELSLITQIGFDHMQFLGDSLEEIAGEKAGIIKKDRPIVIGDDHIELRKVFDQKAEKEAAPVTYCSDWTWAKEHNSYRFQNDHKTLFLTPDLKGNYILKNIPGVLETSYQLSIKYPGITDASIQSGIANTMSNTGIKGRWQILRQSPLVICDVGHNVEGVREIINQLSGIDYDVLHIIWGTVNDKSLEPILELLPKEANYYFCEPGIPRAMPADELMEVASGLGLKGHVIGDVNEALASALEIAKPSDLVFIGGSTFVVAELKNI